METALPNQEERNWALGAHVGPLLLSFIGLGLLAPLIVLVLQGDKSKFVRAHTVEALNFQLTMTGALVLLLLPMVLLPCPFLLVLPVLILLDVLFPILAAVQAHQGNGYRYPFAIRLVK